MFLRQCFNSSLLAPCSPFTRATRIAIVNIHLCVSKDLQPLKGATQTQRYDIDVTVAHVSAETLASSGNDFKKLLDTRARSKTSKYAPQLLLAGLGVKFVPFALTSMGTLHKEALDLVSLISKYAEDCGRAECQQQFYRDWMNKMQLALHKGNVKMQDDLFRFARPPQLRSAVRA